MKINSNSSNNNQIIIKSLWRVSFYKLFDKIVNIIKIIQFLKQKFSKNKYKNNNIFAFSLIELSIVLIIIGLLVSGIIGGQSLMNSAKIRNLINDFYNLERSIYAFRSVQNRLPGDINNDGLVDLQKDTSVSYSNNQFKFPYNGTDAANNHYTPNVCSAPFVEMYLEGVYDFEPTGRNGGGTETSQHIICRNTAINGGMPFSQSFSGNFFGISTNIGYGATIGIASDRANIFLQSYNDTKAIRPNIARDIDLKFDDGKYNKGKMRSYCKTYSSSGSTTGTMGYDEAEEKGGRCTQLMYFF